MSAPDDMLRICGNCMYYKPHRDAQTGRAHPSKQGLCGWRPQIKWAMAYRRNGYGWREQDPLVYPVGVWKHTDAKTCACFSPTDEAHRRAEQNLKLKLKLKLYDN